MKKIYFAGNYPDKFTASGKAKIDAEEIISNMGFKNVGLKRKSYPIGMKSYFHVAMTIVKLIFSIPFKSIMFLQYPYSLIGPALRIAKLKKTKTILLVHDLNTLRDWNDKNERGILNSADVLIVHTDNMESWLKERQIGKRHIVLGIFDYLDGGKIINDTTDSEKSYRLVFAGNLGKSEFIDKISLNDNVLNLYGIGIEKRKLNKGVFFKGCFPPEKLAANIEGDFGLVWDGDSVTTCSGQLGEYLKLIAPHKLSMYLSAGLPVIVWSKSAMSRFVVDNNLGIAVDSLSEIENVLKDFSLDQYKVIKHNVDAYCSKLEQGFHLSSAVTGSIDILS